MRLYSDSCSFAKFGAAFFDLRSSAQSAAALLWLNAECFLPGIPCLLLSNATLCTSVKGVIYVSQGDIGGNAGGFIGPLRAAFRSAGRDGLNRERIDGFCRRRRG